MKQMIYNKKNIAEEHIFKDNGKIINLNEVETFVVEIGQGECIIFVNGLAVTSYTWRGVIMALKDKYHVFAIDFKGVGSSEKSRGEYNIEVYTEQIKSLIKYYNISKATLIGNSLGGGITLNYALKYPEDIRRLILIDTVGYQKNKKVTSFLIMLFRFKIVRKFSEICLSKNIVKIIIKWAVENESIINREMIEAYYEPLKAKGGIEALTSLIKSLGYSDLNYEGIKNITVPTLIIWGDKDKWIPKSDAFEFCKNIKNSKLVILNDCGHAPQEEYPETIAKLIENFMNL